MDLSAWLDSQRLIVCVGSGGVGKTTTAATIGLWGALRGRKTMVLTIDPARRLANSLGLKQFGNAEQRIDLSSIPEATGELWAMMLDSRSTFDSLITRVAPTPETAQRILDNHVYRHMADTFAGSQDYMATEQLFDLAVSGRYDLVVLDTPPVKNALDFLESPGRLLNFVDERILRWYLRPADTWSSRLMASTSSVVNRLLAYVFGKEFLEDLGIFFEEFEHLLDGFRERNAQVLALFRRPDTGFVTVCAPTESSVDVATFFQEELSARDLPRAGVVVNQVHRCEGTQHDAASLLRKRAQELGEDLDPTVVHSVMARLGMAHRRLHALTRAEQRITEKVRHAAIGGGFYQEVPRLEGQVHTLAALYTVGRNLFLDPAQQL